jgi:hypothetical protein
VSLWSRCAGLFERGFSADPPTTEAQNLVPEALHSQAIAPRSQYGRATLLLEGQYPIPIGAVTNALSWDPLQAELLTRNVLDVSASYTSGPEHWLSRSGVTGWLGYWEKDVYRVSRAARGATRVRMRTLPNDGEFLQPKLCVGSAAHSPVMPEPCANASAEVELPAGEAYVIVFADAALPHLRGDSVRYALELE